MKRLTHFPVLSLLLLLLLSQGASAQWTTDPTLNTEVRDQASLEATVTMIATAPNGNSYISWAEASSGGGYQMRMQLVDSNGYNLWGSDGISIDNSLGETLYRYDMKVDDSGNVVLAVQDARSGVDWPVVYKIDQSGNELWGTDGIQLTDPSATSGLSAVLSFTDSNNVLVAWTAQGTKAFVSFQKLSPTGTFMWADNGNIIDGGGTVNYERAVFVRTSGEQFIIQYEKRSGFGLGVSTMYAQSYNSDASTVWTDPTEVSTSSIGFAAFPAPIPDGYGGFFLTFTSGNPSSASISEDYAQRVYSDGHTWAAVGDELGSGTTQERFDGGAVYVPSQNKYYACISATDLTQGSSGISLQEIDTSGSNLLGNGQVLLPLSDGTNATIIYVTGIKSTDTGLVVLYEVGTQPSPVIIKALSTNFNGNFNWPDTSAVVSSAPSNKMKYGWGDYTHHQFVAAWTDMRLSSGGVYAQNILGNGHLGAPPACATIVVAADTASGTVGAAYADTLSQVGGVTPVIYTLTGGSLPDGTTLDTNGVLSGTPMTSGTYTFVVTVTDSNGCTGSQNDTVVINCPTVSLTAFPSLCDTASPLTLTGGLPAGGTYSGDGVANGTFTPTVGDTGTFHITYTYTVGNCTDSASQSIVVSTCGDTTNAVRNVAAQDLFQCIPNPSNGFISIRFNNSVSGNVTVKMLDMTGRLLWTDEQSANGAYNKAFDISAYAKGIYLLQVNSSAGESVMKITLQ